MLVCHEEIRKVCTVAVAVAVSVTAFFGYSPGLCKSPKEQPSRSIRSSFHLFLPVTDIFSVGKIVNALEFLAFLIMFTLTSLMPCQFHHRAL